MAQSDSSNTDLSNSAIVHSPVAFCSDLDTQRGREDEHIKEEDDEVELAEEVGEDVLMMAGDSEDVGENTEQNEPEEGMIIQMLPQSNGVLTGENRRVESLKENFGKEEELGDKCNQKIDEGTNEEEGGSKGEEESNDRHEKIENPCDLITVINGERQEQFLDKCEVSKQNREEEQDKQDLTESVKTDVTEERVCEENGGGEHLKENSGGEEEPYDDDDNQNIDEEMNDEASESKTNDGSDDRHAIIENSDDLKTVTGWEGQAHIFYNREDNKKDIEYEASKQEATESLETQIREKMIGDTDGVFKQQELASCIDAADHIHGPTVVQQLEEETQLSINETYKEEIVHTEGEITEIGESPTVVTSETSEMNKQLSDGDGACQPSTDGDSGTPFDTAATVEVVDNRICQITNESEITDENDNTSKQHDTFVDYTTLVYTEKNVVDDEGEEIMMNAKHVLDDVLEVEGKESQEVEQSPLNVVCSEEQSQTEKTGGETLSSVVNEIFQEEQLQSGASQMVREEQNMTEEGDNDVSKSLCEEEKGEDEHEEVEKQNKFEVEVFEMEEASEASSPRIEGTVKEKRYTTEEKSELQGHPLTTQSEEGMGLKDNITEQLKDQALPAGRDNTEDLMAEMEMANEPVTVLDDEFDELEEAPCIEMGEQKLASVTANNTMETTKVEESRPFQNRESEHREGNKETHEAGKEEIKTNEKPKDNDRRVKELHCEMVNVDPQPSKKEDWRSVRVPPPRRKDDDWIKKEPQDVKEPEVQDWRKELKPVRKHIQEPELGHKESSLEKKCLPKQGWIKEMKSVVKDESLPKKRDAQVKKKHVVLLEDGHSYFPQWEERNENREEVKLISHKKMDPSPPVQDQAYEISLYVKVIMKNSLYCLYKKM